MHDESEWLRRMEVDGLVEQTDEGWRPTRRAHAALARAAHELYRRGQTLTDVRVPIAWAIIDAYPGESPAALALAVAAILPVVETDLERVLASPRART